MSPFFTSRTLVRADQQRAYAQRMNALPVVAVLLVALHCSATVGGAAACPGQKHTASAAAQLLADGNAAYESGNWAKAEACWVKIRESAGNTPDWPKAVFNLGLLE